MLTRHWTRLGLTLDLTVITNDVIETACSTLVIGDTYTAPRRALRG